MDQSWESDERKRFRFSVKVSEEEKDSSDMRGMRRNRQISLIWNHGFHKMDTMKRRQSLDPRYLQQRREFSGKRFLGENQEYTDAKESKESAVKHRIIRRHSFDSITSDQKQYVMNRATFASRYYPEEDPDTDTSVIELSSSSSNGSISEENRKNMVYRVSFADPERVEAIQALLSNKTKKSIIVQHRPSCFFDNDKPPSNAIFGISSEKRLDAGASYLETQAVEQREGRKILQMEPKYIQQPSTTTSDTPSFKRPAPDSKTSKSSIQAAQGADYSNSFRLAPLCELL